MNLDAQLNERHKFLISAVEEVVAEAAADQISLHVADVKIKGSSGYGSLGAFPMIPATLSPSARSARQSSVLAEPQLTP